MTPPEGIARVIVDVALDREFDYRIPSELAGRVAVGSRVSVSFGRRSTDAYVVALAAHSDIAGLKPIRRLLHEEPLLTPLLLKLARWMAGYYCAPVEQAVRALLPGAVRRKGARAKKRMYVRKSEVASPRSEGQGLSPKQQAVFDAIEDGGRFLAELTAELGITAAPVKTLAKKGLVTISERSVGRDPLADKEILPTRPLDLMPEQAEALELIKRTLEERRPEVGCRKSEETPPASDLRPPTSDLRPPASDLRPPASDLRRAQHVVLLYGVTGSGKTEVYLQAIDHVLAMGRGAIVLVPEISLTPQTVDRFRSRFGGEIAVLHSHLGEGERHDEWHRIRSGKARIVIGARSAVFAPVRDLALIVVDEEHEPSYKQEDVPRYHARDVAVMRGVLERAVVVLGSATPSLESWLNARKGKYALAVLPKRADHRRFPAVRVIDMRLRAPGDKQRGILSQDLLNAMRDRIEKTEQTILFLNRRGFSSSLICPACGHVARCDACSVSLTYHRHSERLHCHICGTQRRVPARCPGCSDPRFRYAGAGTQRVEHVVRACFPQARIQRMDSDVTRRKDAYDRILGDFRVGKIDVLIGTQMIAKGLHFPNVTLVGVIHADLSLHMPDFRAGERTFQLLAQVAGRAGRGDVAGEVFVQTFTPFQPAVQAARRVDFEGFSDQELATREELAYPPYTHMVCLGISGTSEEKTAFVAGTLSRQLKPLLSAPVIGGEPAPAPLSKAKGRYRFQLILRCRSVRAMTDPIRQILDGLSLPGDVRVSVDVDAVNMM